MMLDDDLKKFLSGETTKIDFLTKLTSHKGNLALKKNDGSLGEICNKEQEIQIIQRLMDDEFDNTVRHSAFDNCSLFQWAVINFKNECLEVMLSSPNFIFNEMTEKFIGQTKQDIFDSYHEKKNVSLMKYLPYGEPDEGKLKTLLSLFSDASYFSTSTYEQQSPTYYAAVNKNYAAFWQMIERGVDIYAPSGDFDGLSIFEWAIVKDNELFEVIYKNDKFILNENAIELMKKTETKVQEQFVSYFFKKLIPRNKLDHKLFQSLLTLNCEVDFNEKAVHNNNEKGLLEWALINQNNEMVMTMANHPSFEIQSWMIKKFAEMPNKISEVLLFQYFKKSIEKLIPDSKGKRDYIFHIPDIKTSTQEHYDSAMKAFQENDEKILNDMLKEGVSFRNAELDILGPARKKPTDTLYSIMMHPYLHIHHLNYSSDNNEYNKWKREFESKAFRILLARSKTLFGMIFDLNYRFYCSLDYVKNYAENNSVHIDGVLLKKRTLLYIAIEKGLSGDKVISICDQGADINFKCDDKTPLILAIEGVKSEKDDQITPLRLIQHKNFKYTEATHAALKLVSPGGEHENPILMNLLRTKGILAGFVSEIDEMSSEIPSLKLQSKLVISFMNMRNKFKKKEQNKETVLIELKPK